MDSTFADDLAFFRIDPETCTTLRALWPMIEPELPAMLDRLYAHILANPALKAMFVGEANVAGAQKAQAAHWARLFSGRYDDGYSASVRRIAVTHARIGLEPRWYIGAYLVTLEDLHALLTRRLSGRFGAGAARLEPALRALDRAVLLDLQLVVSSYLAENEASFRRRLAELAEGFDAALGGFLRNVHDQAKTLRGGGQALLSHAERGTREAGALASGAEQSSVNMQTVASAVEEITASIGEITRQMQQAGRITAAAVGTVERADGVVRELNQAAGRIGEVVGLIQTIAGQTNLLALNATIEAARAGDAGKGFAVVAGEVKSLSGQTARATEDIRQQVAAVQHVVAQIAEAMGEIGAAVGEIQQATAGIAGAVEEQSAVTQEISRSVANAAAGTETITASARTVADVAAETVRSAGTVADASNGLEATASDLQEKSALFIDRIRQADRRQESRSPADIPAILEAGQHRIEVWLSNVSANGAGLRGSGNAVRDGQEVTLTALGFTLPARVVGSSPRSINLAFVRAGEGAALQRAMERQARAA